MTSTAIDLSAIRTDQTSYKGTFRALIGVYSTAEVDALIGSVGSSTWGSIGGTLSNQTDLQNALNAKASSSHTHSTAEVTGLDAALSGKQATLVSGTNIKTINGVSVLGSGDIIVSGGIGGSTGATDNAVLRADGTGGGAIQSSSVTIDDLGSVTCKNGTFKHTTSANPGGLVIRDYQTLNGGFSNLEIAASNWAAGTGLQFINHNGNLVCTTVFQCTSNFGAQTLYAGVSGNPGAVENGVRITADTTNAYIFTIKYASSPYPPLIVSGAGIKLNTGNGAWANQGGWGTTALELKTDQSAVFGGPTKRKPYTVATLPSASAWSGFDIRVSDRGNKGAYSDGTNWLFDHDNSIVS